jgi:hypothetical protein
LTNELGCPQQEPHHPGRARPGQVPRDRASRQQRGLLRRLGVPGGERDEPRRKVPHVVMTAVSRNFHRKYISYSVLSFVWTRKKPKCFPPFSSLAFSFQSNACTAWGARNNSRIFRSLQQMVLSTAPSNSAPETKLAVFCYLCHHLIPPPLFKQRQLSSANDFPFSSFAHLLRVLDQFR